MFFFKPRFFFGVIKQKEYICKKNTSDYDANGFKY